MYPAYYSQWPNAWRRNPHVHYASDVRPEGKYTTKLPFHQLNYNGTEQAQHDPPTPDPLHTPRHTRQMLPVRPALRHLAPPPVLPRRPVPLPPQTPAPPAYAYATPYVHQHAPTTSAPQQAAPRPPPTSASNAHSVPLANPLAAAPPARPVSGRMPIWSHSAICTDFVVCATGEGAEYESASGSDPDYEAASTHLPAAGAPGVQTLAHPPSTSAESPQGTLGVAGASDFLLQRAVDHQSGHGGGSVMPENTSTGANSRPNAGEVVVNDKTSFKHRDGICTLTVLSPWEAARSLKVTTPITLNDLRIILRRAPNLETAQFACIIPDSGTNRDRQAIHADNLKSLVIGEVQTSIRGVLNNLTADELKSLHVSYAPGMAHHLWQDEQGFYNFLRTVNKHEPGGIASIMSNDSWYHDHRAEHLRVTLELATTSDWTISVQ
ncbi:hypothetical protein EV714DRAFT_266731 [Schizophyllum commune]